MGNISDLWLDTEKCFRQKLWRSKGVNFWYQ
ncbi:hypothetical protein TSAR_014567 [Trichomalopsis sarcophagae]|uniref:Uncharacterized protein n=1 Tax=Trichomalopsis sarcophagae TaxID=543379 RepID=A0A232ERV0_9HYME|nr:hypothetical protein TSAR_014567 [Trichomalopsis sarcophagae]